MDWAFLVLCALLINAAFAGPRRWYARLDAFRLAAWPQRMVRDMERRLNRDHRAAPERQLRGAIVLAAAIMAAWLLGALLQTPFIDLIALVLLLPLRPAFDLAQEVRKSLQARDILNARRMFEGTVWRHHALLDEHGLARASIEYLMAQFGEKILCPILWYAWLGLPGLFIARTVTLLHETLPKPSPGQPHFAVPAQFAHFLVQYIPSRLSVLMCMLAAFLLPGGNIQSAFKPMPGFLTELSPVLLLREASSVLKLSLGGPTSAYAQTWLGTGSAQATASDIRRALMLFALLSLLLFIGLGFFL